MLLRDVFASVRVSVGQHKYYTVEPQMKQDYIKLYLL